MNSTKRAAQLEAVQSNLVFRALRNVLKLRAFPLGDAISQPIEVVFHILKSFSEKEWNDPDGLDDYFWQDFPADAKALEKLLFDHQVGLFDCGIRVAFGQHRGRRVWTLQLLPEHAQRAFEELKSAYLSGHHSEQEAVTLWLALNLPRAHPSLQFELESQTEREFLDLLYHASIRDLPLPIVDNAEQTPQPIEAPI